MGLASSLAMTQQCLGPEVAAGAVKYLAGATQAAIEVCKIYSTTENTIAVGVILLVGFSCHTNVSPICVTAVPTVERRKR